MTKIAYYRTCDKLRTAYKALATAAAEDPSSSAVGPIGRAMAALTKVPKALRVQTCTSCNEVGYRLPRVVGTITVCDHPDVPAIDITQQIR